MTSVIINDNKKSFEKLIDIMSEYIPDNNYFTYNGKPILNNTTLNTSNDLYLFPDANCWYTLE